MTSVSTFAPCVVIIVIPRYFLTIDKRKVKNNVVHGNTSQLIFYSFRQFSKTFVKVTTNETFQISLAGISVFLEEMISGIG